jgi:ketosteroid isomerase-like protein
MSIERTRQTLTTYLDELLSFGDFARCFTDDVTLTFMGTDRVIAGREAARTTITFVHQQAFRTRVTAGTILYGDAGAMLEAQFTGTHIGEFEGVPATGRQVDVPYAVAYDVRGDRISALRLYFPLDLLMRQIAGAAQPAAQAV